MLMLKRIEQLAGAWVDSIVESEPRNEPQTGAAQGASRSHPYWWIAAIVLVLVDCWLSTATSALSRPRSSELSASS